MTRYSVMIIDDEKPARRKVRLFLKPFPMLEVVAEAGNGLEALPLIEKHRPDLVFLDIQMPRMNGFELLDVLPEAQRPRIIFTTAFDQFAVRAFEVRALDYLLKPFDEARFNSAVRHALSVADRTPNVNRLIEDFRKRPDYVQRILLRGVGKITFVRVLDILRVEAAEKYVEIFTAKDRVLHRATMKEMEHQLDPGQFVRLHRCHIVNIDAIQEMHPLSHGDYVAVLRGGTRLPVGRSYKDAVMARLRGGISK